MQLHSLEWHSPHPQFSAHAYCGQTVAHLSCCWALVVLSIVFTDSCILSTFCGVVVNFPPDVWNMFCRQLLYTPSIAQHGGAQSLMSLNRFILLMQLLYWILKFCNDFYRATLCYSTVYATAPFMSVRLSVSPSVTSRKVNLDRFLTIVEWLYCHLRIYFFRIVLYFYVFFSVAV